MRRSGGRLAANDDQADHVQVQRRRQRPVRARAVHRCGRLVCGEADADGSLETLTIIGDGDIDSIYVSGWIEDADGDRTAVVDASAFTGDIDIDFNLDGDDTLTYTGGSGADTVDVDSENGTVHGGDGDDDLDSSSGDNTFTKKCRLIAPLI